MERFSDPPLSWHFIWTHTTGVQLGFTLHAWVYTMCTCVYLGPHWYTYIMYNNVLWCTLVHMGIHRCTCVYLGLLDTSAPVYVHVVYTGNSEHACIGRYVRICQKVLKYFWSSIIITEAIRSTKPHKRSKYSQSNVSEPETSPGTYK